MISVLRMFFFFLVMIFALYGIWEFDNFLKLKALNEDLLKPASIEDNLVNSTYNEDGETNEIPDSFAKMEAYTISEIVILVSTLAVIMIWCFYLRFMVAF